MTAKNEPPRRASRRDLHGILLLDKPLGLSSNQALQRARHALNARKAGHTGSLDPLASGMLPLCFGDATRVSQRLLNSSKTYVAVAALGERRDTGDLEGQVIESAAVPSMDIEAWRAQARAFLGDIEQVPPMYSALKHDGRRLYELARQGKEVERPPRTVRIHAIDVLSLDGAELEIRVHCAKGTYIRTLVEDIARAAGTVAYTASLRRLSVEPFDGEMLTLEAILEAREATDALLERYLLPVDAAVPHLPQIRLSDMDACRFRQGQRLASVVAGAVDGPEEYRVYGAEGEFLGLGQVADDSVLRPRLVLASSGAAERS